MRNKIKKYFDSGLWTVQMVHDAVAKGKITKEDFLKITGNEYQLGETHG